MKLSFPPAELSLESVPEGEFLLKMRNEVLGKFRSKRQAINEYNRIRRELENQLPPHQITDDQKRSLFQQFINDGLVGHNSIRPVAKKPAKSRTFG